MFRTPSFENIGLVRERTPSGRLKASVEQLSDSGIHKLACFEVPDGYDYTKSTQWNYCVRFSDRHPGKDVEGAGEGKGVGSSDSSDGDDVRCTCTSPNSSRFDNIRETRDAEWHGNYSLERRAWQDAFVDSVLGRDFASTAVHQKHPWAILTCGAFGAGKGYVRRWMENQGIIPLRDIVHIDPDYFKTQMPEWPGYCATNPESAGALTHRESGYIQEIITELAMGAQQHVWVDGSLRNVDWIEQLLQTTRNVYPRYQIAIIRVFADEATIISRAEQRGKVTGRRIPISVLHDSIRAVTPKAMHKLYKYVDIVAHVDNKTMPKLQDVVYGERIRAATADDPLDKTWAGLRRSFELRDARDRAKTAPPQGKGSAGGTLVNKEASAKDIEEAIAPKLQIAPADVDNLEASPEVEMEESSHLIPRKNESTLVSR